MGALWRIFFHRVRFHCFVETKENPNISKEIGLRMVLASGLGRPWQFCHPAAKQIKIILRLS